MAITIDDDLEEGLKNRMKLLGLSAKCDITNTEKDREGIDPTMYYYHATSVVAPNIDARINVMTTMIRPFLRRGNGMHNLLIVLPDGMFPIDKTLDSARRAFDKIIPVSVMTDTELILLDADNICPYIPRLSLYTETDYDPNQLHTLSLFDTQARLYGFKENTVVMQHETTISPSNIVCVRRPAPPKSGYIHSAQWRCTQCGAITDTGSSMCCITHRMSAAAM